MVVNQQFTYEDNLNEYNVGDVIRFWNDDIKKATYKMIAHVEDTAFCWYLLIILAVPIHSMKTFLT